MLFTALTFCLSSCGGNKSNNDSQAPIEEAVLEVVEVSTCCKTDSTKAPCDSTKACKEDADKCCKEIAKAEKKCEGESKPCTK